MIKALELIDDIDITRRYRQLLTTPGHVVLDRSFVSELVYGPLVITAGTTGTATRHH